MILELHNGIGNMDQASIASDFENEGGGDGIQHHDDRTAAYDTDRLGLGRLDSVEWGTDGLNSGGLDADENETRQPLPHLSLPFFIPLLSIMYTSLSTRWMRHNGL